MKSLLCILVMAFSSISMSQVRVGSGGNGGFTIEHNAARADQVVTFPGITDGGDLVVNGLPPFLIPPGYVSGRRFSIIWGCETGQYASQTLNGDQTAGTFVNVQPGRYKLKIVNLGSTIIEKKQNEALVYTLRELKVNHLPPGIRVSLGQRYHDEARLGCEWINSSAEIEWLQGITSSTSQNFAKFKVFPGIYQLQFTDSQGRKTSLNDVRVD